MDIRHLESVQVNFDSALIKKLDGRVENLANEREKNADRLEKSKNGESYQLDAAQKQYLYDEGTVVQSLRDQMAGRADDKLPLALGCLAAKYSPQPAGELFDFAVWSALTGGAFGIASGELRFAKLLTTLSRLNSTANKGLWAVGGARGAARAYSACTHTQPKFANQRNSYFAEMDARARAGDLPDNIGFEVSLLKLSNQSAACQAEDVQNGLVDDGHRSSCAKTILADMLPNLLGVPR